MSLLKIGIVSGILNPSYGGPPSVIRGHIGSLGARVRARVFGVYDAGDEVELRGLYPGCELFPRTWPSRWFRGRGLRRGLAEALPGLDLVHAHMLWDHPVWAAGVEAPRAGKPFIVSPHGNILNVRALWPPHKVLYRDWVLKRVLKHCACVHALSEAEAEACRRFGVTCPIRIIPNGLPATEFVRPRDPALALENWPVLKGRKVLLFMGRLAPLKGLDLLLPAFSRLRKRDGWVLVVAGHDYRGYSRHVAAMAGHFGLEGSIILPGPVRGELKQSLLGTADAFVLPSYIEGFSVSLLEALSASLPSVFTTQCHFKELERAGGGWEAEPEAGALGEALEACLGLDGRKLKAMGAAANRLGRAKYTLDAVADGLLDMYQGAVKAGAT